MPRDAQHSFVRCEAVKTAYRQTKDGMVISFAIHPNDLPPELALAPVGTRVLLAVAEIRDAPEPERVPAPPRDPESIRPPAKSEKAAQAYQDKDEWAKASARSGMMCKRPRDQDWLLAARSKQTGVIAKFTSETSAQREAYATRAMYGLLGIESRSEIATDERAFLAFKKIEDAYQIESKYGENLR